jgi:hypothetical protein
LRIAAVDVALGEFQTLSARSATSGIGRPHIPCSTTKGAQFFGARVNRRLEPTLGRCGRPRVPHYLSLPPRPAQDIFLIRNPDPNGTIRARAQLPHSLVRVSGQLCYL